MPRGFQFFVPSMENCMPILKLRRTLPDRHARTFWNPTCLPRLDRLEPNVGVTGTIRKPSEANVDVLPEPSGTVFGHHIGIFRALRWTSRRNPHLHWGTPEPHWAQARETYVVGEKIVRTCQALTPRFFCLAIVAFAHRPSRFVWPSH